MKTLRTSVIPVCYSNRTGRNQSGNFYRPAPRSGQCRKQFLSFCLIFLAVLPAMAVTKTSTGSGNWNNAGRWSPAGVPVAGDAVIIAAGHTVTLNASPTIAALTIYGTLVIGNSNTNRTLTVSGDILVSNGAAFYSAGNGGNNLYIGGHLTNNGTFDMNIGSADANVLFTGTSGQLISGSGPVTDFSAITVNNTGGVNNNTVEIASAQFTAPDGFLTLAEGIFKISGTYTFSNTVFNTANPQINAGKGIWLNNPNAVIMAQAGDTRLEGMIRISAGTYNIGSGADWWLYYYSGAQLIMEGGALNISGAFFGATLTETITYIQTGGVVTVNTTGNNYTVASFEIWAPGSVFTMSGGTIVLQEAATAFTDYINYSVNTSVTGGSIQAGNASTPGGAVFWIDTEPALYNLVVVSNNTPQFQLRSNTTVIHDVTIGGTLDAASQDISLEVGGHWTNNGVFLPGATGSVTFNGTGTQFIGGSAPTTFHHLVMDNTGGGGVVLNREIFVSGHADFTAGILYSGTGAEISFLDNATATGAGNHPSDPSFVHGPVRKTGDDAFTFPVGKAGAGYHPCAISAPAQVTDIFTAEYMRASAASLGPVSAAGLYWVSNCEYWNIQRNQGNSGIHLTLSWNGYSQCNAGAYVNDPASLVLAHFNGTHWDSYGADAITGDASSGTVTWQNVSGFSPFTLGSTSPSANPLPVLFTSTRAWPDGPANAVEWTIETEEGMDRYLVERSTDGATFHPLQVMTPRNNSGQQETYRVMDWSVPVPMTWYRVKAMQLNGDIKYSTIARVSRGNPADIRLRLYPNPVRERQFTVEINAPGRESYSIRVSDQEGRIVYRQLFWHDGGTASALVVLPQGLAAGVYRVELRGTHASFRSALIIQ